MLLSLPPLCISAVASLLPQRDLAALVCTHSSLAAQVGGAWTKVDAVLRGQGDADLFAAWMRRVKARLHSLSIQYVYSDPAARPKHRLSAMGLPPLPFPKDLHKLRLEYDYPVVMSEDLIQWMSPMCNLSVLSMAMMDFGSDEPETDCVSSQTADIWKMCISRLSNFSYTPGLENFEDNEEDFFLDMCPMPHTAPNMKWMELGQVTLGRGSLPTHTPQLRRLQIHECEILTEDIAVLWTGIQVPPIHHLFLRDVWLPEGAPLNLQPLGPTLKELVIARLDDGDQGWDGWEACLEGLSLVKLCIVTADVTSVVPIRQTLVTLPGVTSMEFSTTGSNPNDTSLITMVKFT